jgi:hypothetical protein
VHGDQILNKNRSNKYKSKVYYAIFLEIFFKEIKKSLNDTFILLLIDKSSLFRNKRGRI